MSEPLWITEQDVVAAVCIGLDRLRRSKLMIEDFRPAVSAGKQLA